MPPSGPSGHHWGSINDPWRTVQATLMMEELGDHHCWYCCKMLQVKQTLTCSMHRASWEKIGQMRLATIYSKWHRMHGCKVATWSIPRACKAATAGAARVSHAFLNLDFRGQRQGTASRVMSPGWWGREGERIYKRTLENCLAKAMFENIRGQCSSDCVTKVDEQKDVLSCANPFRPWETRTSASIR